LGVGVQLAVRRHALAERRRGRGRAGAGLRNPARRSAGLVHKHLEVAGRGAHHLDEIPDGRKLPLQQADLPGDLLRDREATGRAGTDRHILELRLLEVAKLQLTSRVPRLSEPSIEELPVLPRHGIAGDRPPRARALRLDLLEALAELAELFVVLQGPLVESCDEILLRLALLFDEELDLRHRVGIPLRHGTLVLLARADAHP
jgi:hypothetical protein